MRLIMILLVLPTPPSRVLHNILHCLRKLQKSTPRTHPLEDFPRPSERPVDRNRRSLPYTHVQSVRGGGTSVTVGAVEVAVAHVVQLLHSVIIATIVAPSQQGPNRPREHVVLPHGPSVLVRTVHRGGEVQDAPPVVPRRDVDAPVEDYPADDVGVPDRAGGEDYHVPLLVIRHGGGFFADVVVTDQPSAQDADPPQHPPSGCGTAGPLRQQRVFRNDDVLRANHLPPTVLRRSTVLRPPVPSEPYPDRPSILHHYTLGVPPQQVRPTVHRRRTTERLTELPRTVQRHQERRPTVPPQRA